jgi:BNR repeat protein
VLVALLAAPANPAWAAAARVGGLRIVSGGGGPLGDCQLQDSKSEVSVATSPADRRRLTAVWIQTVRRADGSTGPLDMWATSTDGGKSWTRAAVPGLTKCTGGDADGAFDPFVSFGPDGVAYLSSLPAYNPPRFNDVYANRSPDGGLHWKSPVVVDEVNSGPVGLHDDDFAPVTADPRIPGRAYIAWGRVPTPGLPSVMFSTTTDGGRSWSPGTVVAQPVPGFAVDLAQVVVLPDSSLLLFYVDGALTTFLTRSGQGAYRVARSTNGGQSWSAPASVAQIPFAALPPTSAAAPDGSVYVAWADPGAGKVIVLRLTHPGQSSQRTSLHTVASEPAAQKATVAVDRDGTVGITSYDNRHGNNNTDAWFAHSHDKGATWSETHLAGPFDPSTNADNATGAGPLGDYEGLAATSDGFAAAFVMTRPQAKYGPSDVFFDRIRLSTQPGTHHRRHQRHARTRACRGRGGRSGSRAGAGGGGRGGRGGCRSG